MHDLHFIQYIFYTLFTVRRFDTKVNKRKFYVFKKPYPTRDGFANVISEVTKSLPKAAGLKYEDVVDNSILEKLDKSGFIDALYK